MPLWPFYLLWSQHLKKDLSQRYSHQRARRCQQVIMPKDTQDKNTENLWTFFPKEQYLRHRLKPLGFLLRVHPTLGCQFKRFSLFVSLDINREHLRHYKVQTQAAALSRSTVPLQDVKCPETGARSVPSCSQLFYTICVTTEVHLRHLSLLFMPESAVKSFQ